MRFTKLKAAGIAAGVAAFAFLSGPASAGSAQSSDGLGTGAGVDYDAACLLSVTTSPPGHNSITTSGCPGVSLYDGSTGATDMVNTTATPFTLCPTVPAPAPPALGISSSGTGTPAGSISACGNVAGPLPAAGSTAPPDGSALTLDTPHSSFGGAQFFTLFQNKNVHTNVPTNPLGGCARVGTGQVFDQHGAWQDGYHFWLSYGVHWDGNQWIHSVKIGEYDPSPDGGFLFTELGYQDSGGWHNSSSLMIKGVDWDATSTPTASGTQMQMWSRGIVSTPSSTCATGIFKTVYGSSGHAIVNAKALTTADQVFVLPVAIPLSALCGPSGGMVCESDLKSVGGFVFFSDLTGGNSTAGLLNTNISNLAYTGGAVGVTDTLGDGPTCPTPTFGGTVPPNPLFTPGVSCQIDDDPVSRGSFLSEWWDTPLNFTF